MLAKDFQINKTEVFSQSYLFCFYIHLLTCFIRQSVKGLCSRSLTYVNILISPRNLNRLSTLYKTCPILKIKCLIFIIRLQLDCCLQENIVCMVFYTISNSLNLASLEISLISLKCMIKHSNMLLVFIIQFIFESEYYEHEK